MSASAQTLRSKRPTEPVSSALEIRFLLSCSVLLGFVVVQFRYHLPLTFGLDSEKIQLAAQGREDFVDKSFTIVGRVYGFLGLANRPTLAAYLSYLSYLVVQFTAIPPASLRHAKPSVRYFSTFAPVVAAVFFGTYTKEILVLPLIVIFVLTRHRHRTRLVLSVAYLCAGALTFRSYWLLIALCYLGFRPVIRYAARRRRVWPILVANLIFFALVAVFWQRIFGQPISYIRTHINEFRQAETVDTIINTFVNGPGIPANILNLVVTEIALIFPFPLLRVGPAYGAAAFAIAAYWMTVGLSAYRMIRSRALDRYQVDVLSIILALVSVQALFEPDYGSYVRHIASFALLSGCVIFSPRVRARIRPRSNAQPHPYRRVGPASGRLAAMPGSTTLDARR